MKVKSVGAGMLLLLHDFCVENSLISPIDKIYPLTDHIPFEKWLKMLEFVQYQYQRDGLGLEIGKRIKPSYIGISAYIAQSNDTFMQYLACANKYNRLWYNYMMRDIKITDNELIVSWDKPSYLNMGLYQAETAISEELQISILFTRTEQLLGHKIYFKKLELTMKKPNNSRLYEEYFKCPIQFECSQTKIYHNKDILNMQLQNPDPLLIEILKPHADQILESTPTEYDFIDQVKKHIITALNNGNPYLKYVAQQLDMSERTFQLELKKYDITFKTLLTDIRHKLALKYLSDKSLSLLDISFLLGYKEQASFNRAFRNWCNLSPSEWRKQRI